jgi:hypothetical protein
MGGVLRPCHKKSIWNGETIAIFGKEICRIDFAVLPFMHFKS